MIKVKFSFNKEVTSVSFGSLPIVISNVSNPSYGTISTTFLSVDKTYEVQLSVTGISGTSYGFSTSLIQEFTIYGPPKSGSCDTNTHSVSANGTLVVITCAGWVSLAGLSNYTFSYSLDGLAFTTISTTPPTTPTETFTSPYISVNSVGKAKVVISDINGLSTTVNITISFTQSTFSLLETIGATSISITNPSPTQTYLLSDTIPFSIAPITNLSNLDVAWTMTDTGTLSF